MWVPCISICHLTKVLSRYYNKNTLWCISIRLFQMWCPALDKYNENKMIRLTVGHILCLQGTVPIPWTSQSPSPRNFIMLCIGNHSLLRCDYTIKIDNDIQVFDLRLHLCLNGWRKLDLLHFLTSPKNDPLYPAVPFACPNVHSHPCSQQSR